MSPKHQTAFGPSGMNHTSVFEWYKRFKEGSQSVRDDERCERSKEKRTPELIGQRVRVVILCWGFKGVQEEVPSEEASTLQTGSVAFPPRECTSPQLHPFHRLFDQDGVVDWCIVLLEMPLTRFEECWPLPTESLPELP